MSFGTAADRIKRVPFNGSVTLNDSRVIGPTGSGFATLTVPGYNTSDLPVQWEIRNITAPGGGSLYVRPGNGTGLATFTAAAGAVLGDYDILAPGVGYSGQKLHDFQEIPYSAAAALAVATLQVAASAGTVTFSGWVWLWSPRTS